METSKQKAIREAYVKLIGEEKFNKTKKYIDSNGYIDYELLPEEISLDDLHIKAYSEPENNYKATLAIPISLQGIETNNGWIKIESEADLPKEDCDCHIIYKDGSMSIDKFYINYKNFNTNHHFHITHYQPIIKPLKPIY